MRNFRRSVDKQYLGMRKMCDMQETTRLSIGEAARILGVSVDTLRRWEAEGGITSTRTLGGQRRYDVTEIERVRAARAAS